MSFFFVWSNFAIPKIQGNAIIMKRYILIITTTLLVFCCKAQNSISSEELNILLQEVRAERIAAQQAQAKADSLLQIIEQKEQQRHRHAHADAYTGATRKVDARTGATIKNDSARYASGQQHIHREAGTQESPKMVSGERPRWLTNRLTIGGYGEITAKHCFFSNNYLRYGKNPERFAGDHYGEFDLPHIVIYLGYDFGKGWSMGSEIEFEHGGTESAIEIEEEEGGEYESEVERGGEVALEQFWLQKKFNDYAVIRAGMQVIPIGGLNAHHEPTEFFGVYRPEGEFTIIPSTWHEVGLTFMGKTPFGLHYQAMFLPGLDSDRFNRKNWVKPGAGSPYEFKLANVFAGAARVDYTGVKGLRLSLSGYCGNSFRNTLSLSNKEIDNSAYKDVKGTVSIGSFDFCYNDYNTIIRGSATYGHLSDAAAITQYNLGMRKGSVSSKQWIASDAIAVGLEAGYDFFSFNETLHQKDHRFFVFARYDWYDSMFRYDNNPTDAYAWCGRQRFAVGINYFPIREVAVKAEFAYGILNKGILADGTKGKLFNDEPQISVGIVYAGFFKL